MVDVNKLDLAEKMGFVRNVTESNVTRVDDTHNGRTADKEELDLSAEFITDLNLDSKVKHGTPDETHIFSYAFDHSLAPTDPGNITALFHFLIQHVSLASHLPTHSLLTLQRVSFSFFHLISSLIYPSLKIDLKDPRNPTSISPFHFFPNPVPLPTIWKSRAFQHIEKLELVGSHGYQCQVFQHIHLPRLNSVRITLPSGRFTSWCGRDPTFATVVNSSAESIADNDAGPRCAGSRFANPTNTSIIASTVTSVTDANPNINTHHLAAFTPPPCSHEHHGSSSPPQVSSSTCWLLRKLKSDKMVVEMDRLSRIDVFAHKDIFEHQELVVRIGRIGEDAVLSGYMGNADIRWPVLGSDYDIALEHDGKGRITEEEPLLSKKGRKAKRRRDWEMRHGASHAMSQNHSTFSQGGAAGSSSSRLMSDNNTTPVAIDDPSTGNVGPSRMQNSGSNMRHQDLNTIIDTALTSDDTSNNENLEGLDTSRPPQPDLQQESLWSLPLWAKELDLLPSVHADTIVPNLTIIFLSPPSKMLKPLVYDDLRTDEERFEHHLLALACVLIPPSGSTDVTSTCPSAHVHTSTNSKPTSSHFFDQESYGDTVKPMGGVELNNSDEAMCQEESTLGAPLPSRRGHGRGWRKVTLVNAGVLMFWKHGIKREPQELEAMQDEVEGLLREMLSRCAGYQPGVKPGEGDGGQVSGTQSSVLLKDAQHSPKAPRDVELDFELSVVGLSKYLKEEGEREAVKVRAKAGGVEKRWMTL